MKSFYLQGDPRNINYNLLHFTKLVKDLKNKFAKKNLQHWGMIISYRKALALCAKNLKNNATRMSFHQQICALRNFNILLDVLFQVLGTEVNICM